jgi:Phosphotransferase enzyme family
MSEIEHPLTGGVANVGQVVRAGDTVRRPAGPHTDAIFALLQHLVDAGFDGVPRPLGLDERGREILAYLPGDVPIPPFPLWSMTDEALASVARLLRRYHEAVEEFDAAAHAWSAEMADPLGGPLLCHCDVCPENVVFRDGEAVGLLDFEFVSPGRRVWDVATTVGMWAPLRPVDLRTEGMESLDPVARARVFTDAYGLAREERAGCWTS